MEWKLGRANRQSDTLPEALADYEYLDIVDAKSYLDELPRFVRGFNESELVGRANDKCYHTKLTVFEDGYRRGPGQVVQGKHERHVRNLMTFYPDHFDDLGRNHFLQIMREKPNTPVEEARSQGRNYATRNAISTVLDIFEPFVQGAIRREVINRAITFAEPQTLDHRFGQFEALLKQYKSNDPHNVQYVSDQLFKLFAAGKAGKVNPKVRERLFRSFVAVGKDGMGETRFTSEINGIPQDVNLLDTKLANLYKLHATVIEKNKRTGRLPDLAKLKDEFGGLYQLLGSEYPDISAVIHLTGIGNIAYAMRHQADQLRGQAGLTLRAAGEVARARVETANIHFDPTKSVATLGLMGMGIGVLNLNAAPPASALEPIKTVATAPAFIHATPEARPLTVSSTSNSESFSAVPTGLSATETNASQLNKEVIYAALDKLVSSDPKWTNRSILIKAMMENGYSLENACGVAGNGGVESASINLNPTIKQYNGGPGRGIFQWGSNSPAGDRFGHFDTKNTSKLVGFAASIGLKWDTIEAQVGFLLHELDTSEQGAKSMLLAAKTPFDSATAFMNGFERPKNRVTGLRGEYANTNFDAVTQAAGSIGLPSPTDQPPSAPVPGVAPPAPTAPAAPVPTPEPKPSLVDAVSTGFNQPAVQPNPNGLVTAPATTDTPGLFSAIQASLVEQAPLTVINSGPDSLTVTPNPNTSSNLHVSTVPAVASQNPSVATTDTLHNASPQSGQLASSVPAVQQVPESNVPPALSSEPTPAVDASAQNPAMGIGQTLLAALNQHLSAGNTPSTSETAAVPAASLTLPTYSPHESTPATAKPESAPASTSQVPAAQQNGNATATFIPIVDPGRTVATQPLAVLPASPKDASPHVTSTELIQSVVDKQQNDAKAAADKKAADDAAASKTAAPASTSVAGASEAKTGPLSNSDFAQVLNIAEDQIKNNSEGKFILPSSYKALGMDKVSVGYKTDEPKNGAVDEWGMYVGQCVSWTAWRLSNDSIPGDAPRWGGKGNAWEWIGNAKNAGIPIDKTPVVGAVLEWDKGGATHTKFGHSTYIEKVFSDGSALVSEINYASANAFSVRIITAAEIQENPKIQIIHFEKR